VVVKGAPAERAAEGILDAVRRAGADLVVMATHGRTGVARAVLGSVADAVVAAAPVPVLLVHPQPAAGPPGDRQRAPAAPRVLVALDGTPEAEAALAPAAALAAGLGARIELARVLTDTEDGALPEGPSGSGAAAGYLEGAAGRLREAGVPAGRLRTAVLYANGRPVADSLLGYAERSRAAMLIVATHGRRGLTRLRHGSVEAAAVARAALPVLVVRTTAPEAGPAPAPAAGA
jgi:nucleotide-binding universal stress UspA family protein